MMKENGDDEDEDEATAVVSKVKGSVLRDQKTTTVYPHRYYVPLLLEGMKQIQDLKLSQRLPGIRLALAIDRETFRST